jgi:hypothetical protein
MERGTERRMMAAFVDDGRLARLTVGALGRAFLEVAEKMK